MFEPNERRSSTFEQLQNELLARAARQVDYIVPLGTLSIRSSQGRLILDSPDGQMTTTREFIRSVAILLEIPPDYLIRTFKKDPQLGETIVHETARKVSGDLNVMLRTETKPDEEDVSAYALVSDSFLRLDHHLTILPALETLAKPDSVVSYFEADERLIVNFLDPQNIIEPVPGDITSFGYRLYNSQSGFGAFKIKMYGERLICTNGLTEVDTVGDLQRRHRGTRLPLGRLQPSADAVSLERVRQMVMASDQRCNSVKGLLVDAPKVSLSKLDTKQINQALVNLGLQKGEASTVMERYRELRDLSLYGLTQALTEMSRRFAPSRQIELESVATKLLKFRPREISLN